MKKVININFQGQVIAIEETAYEILKQYIESLKKYFAREEGGDEIVNDIENRIAELFGNRLKLGISCITDEDVQSIISSIGHPEDFDSDYEQASEAYENTYTKNESTDTDKQSATAEEPRTLNRNANDKIIAGVCSGLAHYFKVDPVWIRIIFVLLFSVLFWVYLILWIVLKSVPLETNIAKRLYRNPTDKWLGGVCGGIGSYFKIDSWIPRILFLAPLMVNFVGILSIPVFPWNKILNDVDFNWHVNLGVVILYAVLWIIIPKANTVKQKLEMMGEDAYIKSIRETVSENVANVKSKVETEEVANSTTANYVTSSQHQEYVKTEVSPNSPPEPPKTVNRAANVSSSERSGCLNAIVVFLKIIFFAFVGVFALTLLAMLGVFLFAGTQLLPLKSLVIDSGAETTLMWLSGILLIGIPIIAIIVWIIRRSMKAASRPAIGIVAVVLWTVGVFGAITLGLKIGEKYSSEGTAENKTALASFSGQKLYVDQTRYGNDYYSFRAGFGPGSDINELPYYTLNEDSLLFSDYSLQIVQSPDSLFYVNTISSSTAKNARIAKDNAEQFSFSFVQKDSLLLLPEFFAVPIRQGFRDQSMVIEVAVPAGKRIEVSENIGNRRGVYTHTMHRKLRRLNRFNDFLDYDAGEEYILQDGALKGTSLKTDSI